jgi:chemotaxis protein histidine kinase CheA/ActR/RegA family two-component response regulator
MPRLEALAVLADEVGEVADRISAALADLNDSSNDQRLREALDFFAEHNGRIHTVTEMLNLTGLQRLCARVQENVAALQSAGVPPREPLAVFLRGPNLIMEYLRAPKDPASCAALTRYVSDPLWPHPAGESEVAEIAALLANLDEAPSEAELEPLRPTEALPEDVSLEVAPDVNAALVEAFLAEAPLQAGAYSSLVEQVISGSGSPGEVLNEARRIVHSVKGAANTIGVRGVVTLTHHLEDLLEYLAERALRPQGRLAKLLMDAADCLEMMLESLLGTGPAPEQAQPVLQRLLDAANAIDGGTDIEADAQENPEPALKVEVQKETAPKAEASALKEPVAKIRVAGATIDEMLRLSSEMTIGRAHVQERLHQVTAVAAEMSERHSLLQNRANEIDQIITLRGVAAGEKVGAGRQVAASSVFDALELDQYSELHGAVHGFVETIADLQTLESRLFDTLAGIETAITQEGLINNELHEHTMRARMVPASTIEPRLARTVRQVCDATGKAARLELRGGDVMLDDHVINDIIHPLTHLLRNAVDHGVEDPGARRALGKPDAGLVALSFAREGNHLVIRCDDDGAGLDLRRIHATAVERGMVRGDASLSEAEITQIIFLPGLSTRASASEVSGRGVGMDIVKVAVEKLKGTIDVSSTPGEGCRFTLRLPLTLGTAHCLVVRAGGELAAIPTDILDRAVYEGARGIERLGERFVYREEQESLEAHDLAHVLDSAGERSLGDAEDNRPVIVVNSPQGKKAVVVDALVSGRDLVVKSLGRHLSGTKGVIGASVLGDGHVLPVLDLQALLRERPGAETVSRPYLVHSAPATREARSADILVVDDSLSVRRALTLLLNGEGYAVRTAKDGVEALDCVSKSRPAAVLADMEMPRMNGLELTTRLRADQSTRGIPVIMVTSRSSEKHRNQAQLAGVDVYLTKPYRDTELLSTLQSMLSKAA